jgi:hypothetical protein
MPRERALTNRPPGRPSAKGQAGPVQRKAAGLAGPSKDRASAGRRPGGNGTQKEQVHVKRHRIGLVVLSMSMVLAAVVQASDAIGIYSVVEKVVLEPSDTAPERIQLWGAFALADSNSPSSYGPVQRGYLYYSCPQGKESVCRKEWADLKSVAAKGTGVGFGHRHSPTGRVRKADEKASAPDPYPIQMGVVRIENASDRGAETLQVVERIKQALKQR